MSWGVLVLAACGVDRAIPEDAPERYAETCAACHEAGGADAPRRGDEVDWWRRRAQGLDELAARVRGGTVAMPPRGLCYTCSDAEIDQLVRFVSGWR